MDWRRRLPGVLLIVVGLCLLALPRVADNYVLYVMTRLFVYGTVSYHGGLLGRRGAVRPLRIVPHGSPIADSREVDR